MAFVKVLALLLTFVPILIVLLISMPLALLGIVAARVMDAMSKLTNQVGEQINEILRSK